MNRNPGLGGLVTLPIDWKWLTVDDIGNVIGGGTPSREVPAYWNGDIAWVTPGELSALRTKFLEETAERISRLGLESSGARLLPPGTLLVTSRATLGLVAIAAIPIATNQGFKSVVCNELVEPTFLYHFFKYGVPELVRRASGTTFLEIPAREFRKIGLPAPPLAEQHRIASILDMADEAIRRTEELIAKLELIRQGLLRDLLTRGISGNRRLREPESARQLGGNASAGGHRTDDLPSLGELADKGEIQLGRGKVISRLDIEHRPGPYPIYSSSAAGQGEFGRYGLYMFDEELITWSVDGGGRPFYRPRHRFSVTNVGGFLRIRALDRWSYRYVHALLEYQHSKRLFDWQSKAHPSVIRDLYLLPPRPLAEQKRIAEVLDSLGDNLGRENRLADKLRLIRRGLTNDLITGRVSVTTVRGDAA